MAPYPIHRGWHAPQNCGHPNGRGEYQNFPGTHAFCPSALYTAIFA